MWFDEFQVVDFESHFKSFYAIAVWDVKPICFFGVTLHNNSTYKVKILKFSFIGQ